MWSRASRVFVVTPKNLLQVRFDSSGLGNAQVKNVDVIRRNERVSEILAKVKDRDGLPTMPSHVEHLAGRVVEASTDDASAGQKGMAGLDLAEKTQVVLKSAHPVRYILEREIYNSSRHIASYYNWITLFGRGIRISKDPNYDKVVDHIAKASDSGMFSSDIHQTVVDVPDDYKPVKTHMQFEVGNKYAVLVGDYFAIRCIYFVEKTKSNKPLIAITKGVEEFATARFAAPLYDSNIIFPLVPHSKANINTWILYNKKSSGYFNGGLYGILLINYDGLPKNQEFMNNMKKFSSNLSVLLKGAMEIEAFENAEDFSTISPFALTTLPAILYQQKNPGVFDVLRQKDYKPKMDHLKMIIEEIERSSSINEAKFILGELASEVKRSYSKIASDSFYADVIPDLVEAVATFD